MLRSQIEVNEKRLVAVPPAGVPAGRFSFVKFHLSTDISWLVKISGSIAQSANRSIVVLRIQDCSMIRSANSASPVTPASSSGFSIEARISERISAERVTLRQPARLISWH